MEVTIVSKENLHYFKEKLDDAFDVKSKTFSWNRGELIDGENLPSPLNEEFGGQKVIRIDHNMDKTPSVTIIDSAGTVVEAHVKYINTNTIYLGFSGPFAGTAYLN